MKYEQSGRLASHCCACLLMYRCLRLFPRCAVKQIREESGCAINIIAPAPNAPSPQQIDRIMTIKGGVAESTKAIYLIAHTIQARAAERKAAGQEPEQAQRGRGREPADGSTAIKLLVHRAAVGAVIGKAGDAIRQERKQMKHRATPNQNMLSLALVLTLWLLSCVFPLLPLTADASRDRSSHSGVV